MRLLLLAGIAATLIGCQSARFGNGIDGNWASDDGVFVATFNNGAFTSRLTTTGETVVADGRYDRSSDGLTLSWTSIAANARRTANCTFTTTRNLACVPSVGQTFTMTRA